MRLTISSTFCYRATSSLSCDCFEVGETWACLNAAGLLASYGLSRRVLNYESIWFSSGLTTFWSSSTLKTCNISLPGWSFARYELSAFTNSTMIRMIYIYDSVESLVSMAMRTSNSMRSLCFSGVRLIFSRSHFCKKPIKPFCLVWSNWSYASSLPAYAIAAGSLLSMLGAGALL